MPDTVNGIPPRVFDVVGAGFGPSNLALAIAMEEQNSRLMKVDRASALFLEKKAAFGWHQGMLLDGATMQVSFLKDLVTMRNPCSRYSFVNYLKSKCRLEDFINQKDFFPTRLEFHDYFEWVAQAFTNGVRYGAEVEDIKPVERDGSIPLLAVRYRDRDDPSHRFVVHARNVVLAPGLEPKLPDGACRSDRVWHNGELLERLETFDVAAPKRFVVVGAGQSAAEVVEYLHRRFEGAEVCAVFSRFGYSPADDSPFANRIFDSQTVDLYYGADPAVRRRILDYHRNTNYSVVDLELIEDLYKRSYREKVGGAVRLRVMNVSRVRDYEEHGDRVRVCVENLAEEKTREMDADALIFATGYRPVDPARFLGNIDALCERDEAGAYRLTRSYAVRTKPALEASIYIQGNSEHTHGITSSLLSNLAVRSGEIADAIISPEPTATRDRALASTEGSHG